jgi:hypothetical protein
MTRASPRAHGLGNPAPLEPLLKALLRVWTELVAQLAMLVGCLLSPFAPECDAREEPKPMPDPSRETQETESARLRPGIFSSSVQLSPRSSRRKSAPRGVRRWRSWLLVPGVRLGSGAKRPTRGWGFCPHHRSDISGALSPPSPPRRRGSRLARQRDSNRQKISALRALAGCPPTRATRLMELEQSRQRALS